MKLYCRREQKQDLDRKQDQLPLYKWRTKAKMIINLMVVLLIRLKENLIKKDGRVMLCWWWTKWVNMFYLSVVSVCKTVRMEIYHLSSLLTICVLKKYNMQKSITKVKISLIVISIPIYQRTNRLKTYNKRY